jgi:hypothetical protein
MVRHSRTFANRVAIHSFSRIRSLFRVVGWLRPGNKRSGARGARFPRPRPLASVLVQWVSPCAEYGAEEDLPQLLLGSVVRQRRDTSSSGWDVPLTSCFWTSEEAAESRMSTTVVEIWCRASFLAERIPSTSALRAPRKRLGRGDSTTLVERAPGAQLESASVRLLLGRSRRQTSRHRALQRQSVSSHPLEQRAPRERDLKTNGRLDVSANTPTRATRKQHPPPTCAQPTGEHT